MNLIDELIRFHRSYENWHEDTTDEALEVYFKTVLAKNRILYVAEADKLLGYVEAWRINFHQFGMILCGERFPVDTQDIETGNICYLANTCIHPEHRSGYVVKALKAMFFKQNYMCGYFVGEARRKKHQPVKVFKRQEFYRNHIEDGEAVGNGKN